jgi:hypothetical protein
MKLREQNFTLLVDKAQRHAKRSSKHLWQRLNLPHSEKTPFFVVGSQRSGTTMLMKVLEKSPYTRVYQEHSRRAFQTNWRLMPPTVIKSLVDESHAPVVVFKPLCDAHLTDQLLKQHPTSKAVWIFRDYCDVANSAVTKWNTHLKDVMRRITEGDWQTLGWRGERLCEEMISLVKQVYTPEMTPQEAAAMQWYLRNQFYFQLGLDSNPRVLLMRYENLVLDPKLEMRRLMHFVDAPYDHSIVDDVSDRSIGKGIDVALSPEVDYVCSELLIRLNQTHDSKFSVSV